MNLGETKTVFAWWPKPRMVGDGQFYSQSGWYWLRKVKVMLTLNGLVAYADDNG